MDAFGHSLGNRALLLSPETVSMIRADVWVTIYLSITKIEDGERRRVTCSFSGVPQHLHTYPRICTGRSKALKTLGLTSYVP